MCTRRQFNLTKCIKIPVGSETLLFSGDYTIVQLHWLPLSKHVFSVWIQTPVDSHNSYSLFNRTGLYCDVVDIKHSGIDIAPRIAPRQYTLLRVYNKLLIHHNFIRKRKLYLDKRKCDFIVFFCLFSSLLWNKGKLYSTISSLSVFCVHGGNSKIVQVYPALPYKLIV